MQKYPIIDDMTKGAAIGGIINGTINGLITWFKVKGEASILLSSDMISSTQQTVLSGAVTTALSLAVIYTIIAYFTWKAPQKPAFFPKVVKMILKNTFFTFGIVVAAAVMVQRFFGSIEVSPITAAGLTALFAGLTGGFVTFQTQMNG
jgi:hypothetical protein